MGQEGTSEQNWMLLIILYNAQGLDMLQFQGPAKLQQPASKEDSTLLTQSALHFLAHSRSGKDLHNKRTTVSVCLRSLSAFFVTPLMETNSPY